MDSHYVYSRTADSWRLTFVHAGKLLHYLTRALLMTLASAGVGLAWLCCWVDRFRSSKGTAWVVPMSPGVLRAHALRSRALRKRASDDADELDELPEMNVPRNVFGEKITMAPARTIDSLLYNRSREM